MKVIVDRARHAALLVKQGSRWVHILRVTGRGLVAEKLTEDELTADWSELTNQTVDHAIATFIGIARVRGGTKAALALLGEAIIEAEAAPC
jgi:hypothetical protein